MSFKQYMKQRLVMNTYKCTIESKKRSIAKTISWRICATFTTMTIVYIFTKEIGLSLGVGVLEVISKMILYYLHERGWGKATWGRVQHPLSQIPVKGKLKPKDMSIIQNKLKELGYVD